MQSPSSPDDTQSNQIEVEITAARDSVERSKALFTELTSTFGLAKASQLWWAYFGAYDAAET